MRRALLPSSLLPSSFAVLPFVLAGCLSEISATDPLPEEELPEKRAIVPDEAGLLAFVNDEATDVRFLDEVVGIDRRAASHIVMRRDGPDAVRGTQDDQPFRSMDDVDSVPYVGPVTLEQLIDWARVHGYVRQALDAASDAGVP